MQRRRLDLSYLVRSGLGIPDYWHPHVEIQNDFQSGQIGRYPLSMDIKADYPGQLNNEGVPIVVLDTMSSPSPFTVILFGLGSHDAFLNTGEERYRRQMMDAARWLKNHFVPLGSGIGWSYPEDLPVYDLKSPWFSGAIQGFALSLLVRVSQLDQQELWRGMVHDTWRSYHLSVGSGGFNRMIPEGVVYEEYPAPELNFVFNGMCFALIGLWEAWKSRLVTAAEEDFKMGLKAVRLLLPRFAHGNWSLYSLTPRLGRPLLASPYYQRINGLLAQLFGQITGDPKFWAYGQLWLASSQSIIRRAAMSLRVGMDRFLHAPSFLQRDKARN
jgi:hypothetical protein